MCRGVQGTEAQLQQPEAWGHTLPAPGCVLPAPGCVLTAPGRMLPAMGRVLPVPGCVLPVPGCALPAPGCVMPAPGASPDFEDWVRVEGVQLKKHGSAGFGNLHAGFVVKSKFLLFFFNLI